MPPVELKILFIDRVQVIIESLLLVRRRLAVQVGNVYVFPGSQDIFQARVIDPGCYKVYSDILKLLFQFKLGNLDDFLHFLALHADGVLYHRIGYDIIDVEHGFSAPIVANKLPVFLP